MSINQTTTTSWAHTYEGPYGVAYFSLGTNFGVGKPHYHVTLDENGGSRSWWLDPEQAEALAGDSWSSESNVASAEQERRQAKWLEEHSPEGS